MHADLHTHTVCSDGTLTPAQLIVAARNRGVSHLAICDHDTIAAYDGLTARDMIDEVTIVPGIEFSAYVAGGEVHILGLGIDIRHERLRRTIRNLIEQRANRAAAMMDRLGELGCFQKIEEEDVAELRRDTVERARVNERLPADTVGASACRLHVAAALERSGDVQNRQEAFGRFIGNKGPAYVPYQRYAGAEAVEVIHEAGGLAILAHPGLYKDREEASIRELAAAGIDGVEVHHPKHDGVARQRIDDLATTLGLRFRSGGSDFHNFESHFAKMFGKTHTPEEQAEAMFAEMGCPAFTPATAE